MNDLLKITLIAAGAFAIGKLMTRENGLSGYSQRRVIADTRHPRCLSCGGKQIPVEYDEWNVPDPQLDITERELNHQYQDHTLEMKLAMPLRRAL